MFSQTHQLRPVDLSAFVLEDEFDFPLKIKKSPRAKRITLRVCQVTGGVKITVPPNLQTSVLRNFINKNIDWIRSNLIKLSPLVFVSEGSFLPINDQDRKILIDTDLMSNYSLTKSELILPKTVGHFETQVKSVFKQIAEDYFRKACGEYAEKLGVKFSQIYLKDPKARWGSCSSDRKLMFSWRLIMAPIEVSSYVAAHEISHLAHMDHSHKFWNVVGSICPNYTNSRNWLRENGRNLHKFVF